MTISEYENKSKCPQCNSAMRYKVISESISRGIEINNETKIKNIKGGIQLFKPNKKDGNEGTSCKLYKMSDEEWQHFVDSEHLRRARISYDDNILSVCTKCTFAESYNKKGEMHE